MSTALSKIIDLVNTKDYYKAEIEIKKLYDNDVDNYDYNKLLGIVSLGRFNYNKALQYFEKCIQQKDNDYDVIVNLSYLFNKAQIYGEAIKYAEKAIYLNKKSPQALQNLATALFYIGKYQEAKKYSSLCIDARGGIDSQDLLGTQDLISLHADILIAAREKEEFINFAYSILKKQYNSSLLLKLFRMDEKLILENHLQINNQAILTFQKLSNLVERNTALSHSYFFLAEYHAKKDKTLSEKCYLEANKLIADMQRDSIFTRQKYAKKIYTFFKEHQNFNHIEEKISKNKGEGLIFIFGMPRSGTTLTESILSTADNIKAGGEKVFFSLQLHQIIEALPNNSFFSDEKFYQDLGDRYLHNIEIQREGKKFFIDKLPENYLFYKFIRLSLPAAKFIHCYRDPWDNAISLFKQNYSVNIFYASSFFGIATEYANYESLIKTWRNLDGEDAFLNVEYEKMVNQKPEYIKKLWEFCGLEGQYNEESRKKHVGITASMQQVTKDIYNTSIKKADFIDLKEKFEEDLNMQRSFWAHN